MLVDDRELAERAARIDVLLEELDSFTDPNVRARATEIVEGLVLLYGEGLARMMGVIAGDLSGQSIIDQLAKDDLVSHLLLLHDLHPLTAEERVMLALEEVRPYLKSHGGNVQLLGVEDGIAKLRLEGSCKGCPSSTMTLKLAIEEAIRTACPDIDGIDAEGVTAPPPAAASFVPLSSLLPPDARRNGAAWVAVGDLQLESSEMTELRISGQPVLFCRLDDTFFAYRTSCPHCSQPLSLGVLSGGELACSGCRHRFDVRAAGRCLDADGLHLDPVPLLMRSGEVKIALDQA
ncbi:MAG TPA: NifU family protein [Chloroflexota bacterium]